MSQERLTMNKLREVLRLHACSGLSNRKIARALKISASTVGYYVSAFKKSPLGFADCNAINDVELLAKLTPYCQQLQRSQPTRTPLNLMSVHQQLKQKGVTRELLWQEHCQKEAFPYSYTEFCRQYRVFRKQQKPSMRQNHKVGDKAFVDYAGPTVPIKDPHTGAVRAAMIFVGVLGASNYTYAEATLTRSLPDWLGAHTRMYTFFDGVPTFTVPDNEKSAVTRACYYDPDLNPQYTALASHYDTVVLPTRPAKPQDKAKVEVAVQVVERWILARLRHHQFFSLGELNQAIAALLADLNNKPFKKLPGTRRSQFEAMDKPALKPLPAQPYVYVIIKKAQVRLDYHIEVAGHFYSVPYQLMCQQVHYQLGSELIEIFHQNQRIASHQRSHHVGQASTQKEHMPHAHRRHHEWTPQVFTDWAGSVGPAMKRLTEHLIVHRPNPECGYRIHLGFLNLAKRYTKPRLEQACDYANTHHLLSFQQVRSILRSGIDHMPIAATNDAQAFSSEPHLHIRGAAYYASSQPIQKPQKSEKSENTQQEKRS